MVVDNLPVAGHPAPHVGEAGLDGGTGILGTNQEGVHTGVEVGVLAVVLHVAKQGGA